jgi:hypothetical protein
MWFLLLLFSTAYVNAQTSQELYLDLIKKCLINSIYEDDSVQPVSVRQGPHRADDRENGLDWPSKAHTMIGLKRLNNIQFCAQEVLRNNIPGDFIETGVWRGGATIFMRAILKTYNDTSRTVWVADSFEGLPKPKENLYPVDRNDWHHTCQFLAVSLEEVKSNFEKYGLLDDQVRFLKGWFSETLVNAPIDKLALLRLDGDMYESTIVALENLYPKLSIGGYILIDDFALVGCNRAVQDFRKKYSITDQMKAVDWSGIYWKKTK